MLQVRLYQPALTALLLEFREDQMTRTCPPAFRRFLTAIASDKAVCALIPPTEEMNQFLTNLCNANDITRLPHQFMPTLQLKVPVLYNLLTQVEFNESIRQIIKALVVKSNAPFEGRQIHQLPLPTDDGDFFPSLSKICDRGVYVLDSKKSMSKDCAKDEDSSKRHKTLTPGLFILNCPCGVCYGFSVMENHESANMPFTILRTRFATRK